MTDLRQGVSRGTHDALDYLDAMRADGSDSLDLEGHFEEAARHLANAARPGAVIRHARWDALIAAAWLLSAIDHADALLAGAQEQAA